MYYFFLVFISNRSEPRGDTEIYPIFSLFFMAAKKTEQTDDPVKEREKIDKVLQTP